MLICVLFFALAAALLVGKEQNLERLGTPARRGPGRDSTAAVRKTSRPVSIVLAVGLVAVAVVFGIKAAGWGLVAVIAVGRRSNHTSLPVGC